MNVMAERGETAGSIRMAFEFPVLLSVIVAIITGFVTLDLATRAS
jgi:NO-binding membrane sensor protein with MHYT domain